MIYILDILHVIGVRYFFPVATFSAIALSLLMDRLSIIELFFFLPHKWNIPMECDYRKSLHYYHYQVSENNIHQLLKTHNQKYILYILIRIYGVRHSSLAKT